MPRSASSSSSSARQALEALGLRLRELRVEAGLTARELARLAGWHDGSKVSKIEYGRQTPTAADIRTWCEHCGAAGQTDDMLASLRVVEGFYVEWRRLTRTGLKRTQQAMVPLYERTRRFRVYEPGVIPGLFQTSGYASALMGAIAEFAGIPDDLEEAVAARLARQRVLNSGDHRFAVVVEEAALRSRVAPAETMDGQLGHLIAMTSLPSVSFGVIPADADRRTMCQVEGFWIFDDERVLIELATGEVTITPPGEIAIYARTFAELAELAVYGADARALMTTVRDELTG